MATAASDKKRGRTAASTANRATAAPGRKRWWFTTFVLVGLPALVWFAPKIVGLSPVLNRIVAHVAADFQGSIAVGGASLGWMSPIVVRDIVVHDNEGRKLADIPLVASEKTLAAILFNPHDVGVFRIERPQFAVVLHDQDSNLEESVEEWAKEKATSDESRVGLSLVVNEAVATIDDAAAGRSWQIDELSCEVVVPRDASQDTAVAASGRVTPGDPTGRFTLRLKMQGQAPRDPAAKDAPPALPEHGEFTVTAQGLRLELFEPLLRRLHERGELSGTLESNVNGHWNLEVAGDPRGELTGQVDISHLTLAGPWEGEDRLRLDSLSVPCTIVQDGKRVEIRRCEIQSDVGHFVCSGTIDELRQFETAWVTSLWDALPHSAGRVQGSLDLAKLSKVLPATLRVRPGMQIDEGAIHVDLQSGPQNGQWACSGRVDTTRLVATDQGRQISWDHPLTVIVAGHDTPDGPVIEQLNGQSDFLTFEGSGTPDYFGLTANFELARLAEELGQFLDLGELRLAGDGFSRVTWKRNDDDSFAGDAELQATNFVLARPGKPAWTDPKLSVTASAKGQLSGREIARVETAVLQVAAATDEFSATLLAPVERPGPNTPWPLEARLRGELQRWIARVEPWVAPPTGWDIAGQTDAVAMVNYTPEDIEIAKCQADLTQLHAWGPTLYLDEPRMRLQGTFRAIPLKNTLRIVDAQFTAADVSGRIQDGTFVATSATGVERIGHAEMQGNLTTLHRWTHDPRLPADFQVSGLMACSLHADLSDRAPALDLSMTIEDLAALSAQGQQWRERQLRVMANATYDEPHDTVELARIEVESEGVRLNATGRIESWSQQRNLTLAGTTEYDWEKLSMLFPSRGNNRIQITGREQRSFSLAGPIDAVFDQHASPADRDAALQRLEGKADIGWQRASIFGMDVGPANLQASLGQGRMQLAPAQFAVSGGTMTLSPAVRFSPLPAQLLMPAGPIVSQIHVSPEMCRQWLMYVAPVLAGTTRVQGSFSAQLAGCVIPLADPAKGEVAGQLLVHSIDLEAGPLVRELASILGANSSVRVADQSKIDFKMVEGRVYHRGVELQFPEVMVRTYGSVGLDQTLAIMAEMSIPPKWLRDNALGDAIKNRTIKIPIAGTLEQPKLDKKVFDNALTQFMREAAGSAVNDGLQKQLDRLLQPLKPR